MEEAEVPLEYLHEEIHHHAEHGGEKWFSWVALSTAILAVLQSRDCFPEVTPMKQ